MGQVPVVAIANQKGGVGKTSITAGLAAAASRTGRRVLVLDLDPQGNVTDILLPDGAGTPGSFGLIADTRRGGGVPFDEAVESAGPNWPGVSISAAAEALSEVDVDTTPGQPLRLRRALRAAQDQLSAYDVALIDCPPSVGRLLIAALVAATDVLIVTEAGAHAVQGVTRVEATLAEVRDAFEQETPRLLGIVVNRYRRITEHRYRDEALRDAYGDVMFAVRVPERAAVADAASMGAPVHALQSEGARAVAAALDDLWADMARRLALAERTAP